MEKNYYTKEPKKKLEMKNFDESILHSEDKLGRKLTIKEIRKTKIRIFKVFFMKLQVLLLVISFFFFSCYSPTYYLTATNFYELNRGMTKEQFSKWFQIDEKINGKPVVGKRPAYSKTFKHGNDIWEVWIFKVFDCTDKFFGCLEDHVEHVAFKNGLLEEWGTGELPLTIRQNPNQFQYDVNIQKR